MNCTTCRFELSQCLDGRLPSGRRTLVLEHVDSCAACGRFWSELQRAQQLVLRLPKQRVGPAFQEQLWERIRAGEGTPEAVFHEPVPLWTKARYALSGAAAAAAVLAGVLWLRHDERRPSGDGVAVAQVHGDQVPLPPAGSPLPPAGSPLPPAGSPLPQGLAVTTNQPANLPAPAMFAAAQRLTADAVAVEAARQFEQRYDTARQRLRQADLGQDAAVSGVLDEANELHQLAEVLLDLRDCDRLSFRDAEVGADLRVAANLLGQSRLQKRSLDTVRAFVAPALQQSERLGHLARLIRVRPSFDGAEVRAEQELLRRLSTQRPDVLPKLFYVLSHDAAFGVPPRSDALWFEDDCGTGFVAPRSRVAEGNVQFQWLRVQVGGAGR
jgi:hypothetical protein